MLVIDDKMRRKISPSPKDVSSGIFCSIFDKFGKRFSKRHGSFEAKDSENDCKYDLVLELQPDRRYQVIEGFGGAVTDSAGMNWKSLPLKAQEFLINSYFSEYGIEYNMIRVPTGSTDFSTRRYGYNDNPPYDKDLSNFTLVLEDKNFKVPMIQECLKVATDEVKVVTTSWRPSKWMLSKDELNGFKLINEDYYQTYADYFCKFAQLYYEQGIKIWALSPANEPSNPFSASLKKESTFWTTPNMGKFISKYLGPTLRNCPVQGIKILANDDQRYALPFWFGIFKETGPEVYDYIDGLAVHFYGDKSMPAAFIARTMKDYPDKFIISTEACAGSAKEDKPKVDLGSWERAKLYIEDILEDLNYNYVGWIDWNMCLNEEGGPTWIKNFVDSPIIVNAEKQEFYKQPMYYAFGQFSKFIPRGSRRIRAHKIVPVPDPNIDMQDLEAAGQSIYDNVAFLTPRGTIVVVIHNDGPFKTTAIQIGTQQISITLDEDSITTLEFQYDGLVC